MALMFESWRGNGNCRKGDKSRDVWDWDVLKGGIWKSHGQVVAATSSYFPHLYNHTPRNPAEKLSSGYKAWELLLHFYSLGPSLFYGLLPERYYKHYCCHGMTFWDLSSYQVTHSFHHFQTNSFSFLLLSLFRT